VKPLSLNPKSGLAILVRPQDGASDWSHICSPLTVLRGLYMTRTARDGVSNEVFHDTLDHIIVDEPKVAVCSEDDYTQ
jgi:hypothetical protein